ncbi:hypothetical protein Tco_0840513 [Tanacetum coccineum]|uniref:Uncharacterized protein n=1 Tax=Tanacetum coccineum TaxID=301880 RepID=A0ABQ5ATS1_9ASTR
MTDNIDQKRKLSKKTWLASWPVTSKNFDLLIKLKSKKSKSILILSKRNFIVYIQARDGKQESSSKSRQARVDKKETGGKQETAIDEKAENTVKECTNWKDKKKDKEQEALLISEDTAFVITGENIGSNRQEIRINFDSKQGKQEKLHSFYTSKRRQARVVKQETASKSRQARVDKKETGGKQETAIDEKAENTVKECTNWKDKKKDKEQEALLISEDTAFVITGENIGSNRVKPNPMDNHTRCQTSSYKKRLQTV